MIVGVCVLVGVVCLFVGSLFCVCVVFCVGVCVGVLGV